MDLQWLCPGDISVFLALASALAFCCPQHAPRWLVEHGSQLEPCESLGKTCCLHQMIQEGPEHAASRSQALPHLWVSLECPDFSTHGYICPQPSAVMALLSPSCHCSLACVGHSLDLSLLGW